MTPRRVPRPLSRIVADGLDAAAVISDLDGCLISGSAPLPGAAELVAGHGERVWIVTNNSQDTAESLATRLGMLGLPVPAERIVTAGETMVRQLAAMWPAGRVAWFGTRRLADLARQLGLELTTRDPRVAALTRDPDLTGHDLGVMTRLASIGVPFWLANPDRFHPASDGTPVPETGAWWAALTAIVDVEPARIVGKPSPDLLTTALARAGVDPAEAVMLGDTDATDGAAARAAGIAFHLVERPGSP